MNLTTISLVTHNMAAAIEFWTACGLRQTAGGPAEVHTTFETADGFRVMLDTAALIESFTPGWTTPRGGHRCALALECDSPADVDTQFARLLAETLATAQAQPYDAPWGQRYATVLDPDGNPVDLFCEQ